MSKQEFSRRKLASLVLQRAWRYFKSSGTIGYTFSLCLRLAWKTVRGLQHLIYSKVRGTTFLNENGVPRQRILSNLRKYSQTEVGLELIRDYNNTYDKNAVLIQAKVKNKGSAVIGYLSANLANDIAPLLDDGAIPIAFFLGVTGECPLGLNFAFSFLPSSIMLTYNNKKKSPRTALQSL